MTQTDGKIHHVLGLEELTLLKRLYYTRQSTFSEIAIKIPIAFFTELKKKIILNIVWKHKDPA